MIWHSKFVWLHLPRSAGTATARWMRQVQALTREGLSVDPDGEREKHDNLAIRAMREGHPPAPRAVAMNFRSLAEWLQSNYRFARAKGLMVPEERYLGGEYFSLRTGGWCPADWWLGYFETERVTHFLRCDRLEQDWRAFIRSVAGLKVPESLTMPWANRVGTEVELSAAWKEGDWSAARTRNPRWAELEARVLGAA